MRPVIFFTGNACRVFLKHKSSEEEIVEERKQGRRIERKEKCGDIQPGVYALVQSEVQTKRGIFYRFDHEDFYFELGQEFLKNENLLTDHKIEIFPKWQ